MATSMRWCAALAALFLMAAIPAQANGAAARLAAAKLAETRGDLAGAEAELRQALAGANDADRAAIQSQLAALLRKQGKAIDGGAAPQEPAAAGDPVQRLIADLERGSREDPQVDKASKELASLGSLAVPPLLAALPKLGPFGLSNALRVLGAQENASIAPAVQQLLDGGDQAVVQRIADQLSSMHRSIALPVAKQLAGRELPVSTRLALFTALRRHDAEGAEALALGVRLAKQPAAQAELQNVLGKTKDSVSDAVNSELMVSGTGQVRANATFEWLRRQSALTEEVALEHLQKLEPASRCWVARCVAESHPGWVRIGLVALRANEEGSDQVNEAWFQSMEWWRMPDQAAPALLALPNRQSNASSLARVFPQLVDRGWTVPAELQQALATLMLPMRGTLYQRTFVRAIPVPEEERALATWQSLDAQVRREFTDIVVELERPWHRLVAQQLAACEQAYEIPDKWINRDWRGAPADAVETLVATVARFPAGPDGNLLSWHTMLPRIYERCTNLPAAVVRPAAERGSPQAWNALASREPKEALVLARAQASSDDSRIAVFDLLLRNQGTIAVLDGLLRDHGTDDDIPIALRLVTLGVSPMAGTEAFLARHGRGRLDVIALGSGGSQQGPLRRIVLAAAEGVSMEQLTELLPLMERLPTDVMQVLVETLLRQIRGEHGKLVAEALVAPCARGVESYRLSLLTQFAAMTKNPVCLPPLRQLLAKGTTNGPVSDDVAEAVARAILDLAGTARRPAIEELLASSHPRVVGVALLAPEHRADAELRALAKAAIVRLADSIELNGGVFAALAPADAAALAKYLLLHERFPAMKPSTCKAVLHAPRRAGLPEAAATLARGARHPDPEVRLQTAVELGNTFTREAAPFLLEMLKDESPDVRKLASDCLDQIANYLDARTKWEERLK